MPRKSKETTSALIQEATIKLFTAKGYNGVTMAEIAQAADIAKRTLYKYYPSKMLLFASIFERYLKMLIDKVKSADYGGLSFGETLTKTLVLLYDFTNEHQEFMRLFWMLNNASAEGDSEEDFTLYINRWNTELIDQTTEFLKEKQPQGMFQRYSPELVTHMLSAVNKGIYLQTTKEANLGLEGPAPEELLNLFCEMMLVSDQSKL